jgi:hypothetical protein
VFFNGQEIPDRRLTMMLNNANQTAQKTALMAKQRMALLMLLFLFIHLIEAYITFPFVDHATKGENLVYGLIVTAPFLIGNIIFIYLIRRDLSKKLINI